MSSDRYAGLGPADRLEAQRRDEAEAERVRRLNEPFRRELALRRRWPDGEPTAQPPAGRRRGRPPGSRAVTKELIVSTFHQLAKQYARSPTQAELAANLTPRIEVRTLQDSLTAFGLPWPIE